jgi:hypothetical protein
MKLLKPIIFTMLLPLTKLLACGGGGWYPTYIKNETYNFLDPSLINLNEDNPLYNLALSSRVYGYIDRVEYFTKKSHKLNITEWQNYLGDDLKKKELEELFYDNKNNLKERYTKLSNKIDNPAFKTYINFVSEQEKFVSTDYQDEPLSSDGLLEDGEKYFKK